MDTRSLIIEATADLLAESLTGDVATRAVCEAAGVQQPVLYRLFGDKDGLLAATVDHVWSEYLSAKRAAPKSDDPLADLRAGWDSHTAFALAHPNAYKLLYAPALRATPSSAEEAMRILRGDLDRLAAQGRMRLPPEVAARMIMAANTGVALALITRPAMYPDTSFSTLVRDAVHHAILLATPVDTPADTSAAEARAAAALTLLSGLPDLTPTPFTPAESGLLGQWLAELSSEGMS